MRRGEIEVLPRSVVAQMHPRYASRQVLMVGVVPTFARGRGVLVDIEAALVEKGVAAALEEDGVVFVGGAGTLELMMVVVGEHVDEVLQLGLAGLRVAVVAYDLFKANDIEVVVGDNTRDILTTVRPEFIARVAILWIAIADIECGKAMYIIISRSHGEGQEKTTDEK